MIFCVCVCVCAVCVCVFRCVCPTQFLRTVTIPCIGTPYPSSLGICVVLIPLYPYPPIPFTKPLPLAVRDIVAAVACPRIFSKLNIVLILTGPPDSLELLLLVLLVGIIQLCSYKSSAQVGDELPLLPPLLLLLPLLLADRARPELVGGAGGSVGLIGVTKSMDLGEEEYIEYGLCNGGRGR